MQSTDRIKEFKEKLFRINMDDLIRETSKKQAPLKKTGRLTFIGWLIAALLGGLFLAKLDRPQPKPVPVQVSPTPEAKPLDSRVPPLPEVRRAMPMPVPSTGQTPRAQLLHVRPIGTVEDDRMPDGRILTTRYKGELQGAASLPTRGANLGDMWYTQNDGHCWVLAPLPGSSTVGWIDP